MKTPIFFTALLIPLFMFSQGVKPNLDWVSVIGGNENAHTQELILDHNKNVIVTGSFGGVVDLDPSSGVFNVASNGYDDIFIQKLDSNGNFLWGKSFGSSSGYELQSAIAVDATGNIFVTGMYSGTVDFNQGSTPQYLTTRAPSSFVLKLDANGSFLWAKSFDDATNPSSFTTTDIATDTDGNVVVTGWFFNNTVIDFNPGSGSSILIGYNGSNGFFLKLNSLGDFEWVKEIGGNQTNAGNARIISLKIDLNDQMYLSGFFTGKCDFNPGSSVHYQQSKSSNDNGFIVRLDENANFKWAKVILSNDKVWPSGLETDVDGNVILTGMFYGNADFDLGVGIESRIAKGYYDYFVLKLDDQGGYQWAHAFGDTLTGANGHQITTDEWGNIYTSGYFKGNIDFDPGPDTVAINSIRSSNPFENGSFFVQKLDSDGGFKWVRSIDVGAYSHAVISIKYGGNNNLYLSSCFEDLSDFDPGNSVHPLSSVQNEDVFVSKWSQSFPVGIEDKLVISDVLVYPVPTKNQLHIELSNNKYYSVQVFDGLGKLVLNKDIETNKVELNLGFFPSGVYYLRFNSDEGLLIHKAIKY